MTPEEAIEALAGRVRARAPVREPDPASLTASQGNVGWGDLAGQKVNEWLNTPRQAFEESGKAATGQEFDPNVMLRAGGMANVPAPHPGGSALGTLHLSPRSSYTLKERNNSRTAIDNYEPVSHKWNVTDEYGTPQFKMNASQINPDELFIDWVGHTPSHEALSKWADKDWSSSANPYKELANGLGAKEMRSLVKALMAEYPGVKTLTGERISGGRLQSGKIDFNGTTGPVFDTLKLPGR